MDSSELQLSSFTDNNVKIESKTNIEDLVLPNKLYSIPLMENNFVKKEPWDYEDIDIKLDSQELNPSHFENGQVSEQKQWFKIIFFH